MGVPPPPPGIKPSTGSESSVRLDFQPLFGKGARVPPPNSVNISDCRAFTESIWDRDRQSDKNQCAVILWYAQACRIRPLQIQDNFRNRLAIPNKHRIFPLGSKEAFCSNSLNISNCRCKRKFSKCQAHADFSMHRLGYFVILHTKNLSVEILWKFLTAGHLVYKALPGCRAFRHSEKKKTFKACQPPQFLHRIIVQG